VEKATVDLTGLAPPEVGDEVRERVGMLPNVASQRTKNLRGRISGHLCPKGSALFPLTPPQAWPANPFLGSGKRHIPAASVCSGWAWRARSPRCSVSSRVTNVSATNSNGSKWSRPPALNLLGGIVKLPKPVNAVRGIAASVRDPRAAFEQPA